MSPRPFTLEKDGIVERTRSPPPCGEGSGMEVLGPERDSRWSAVLRGARPRRRHPIDDARPSRTTPTPNPSPQGGRERESQAAAARGSPAPIAALASPSSRGRRIRPRRSPDSLRPVGYLEQGGEGEKGDGQLDHRGVPRIAMVQEHPDQGVRNGDQHEGHQGHEADAESVRGPPGAAKPGAVAGSEGAPD